MISETDDEEGKKAIIDVEEAPSESRVKSALKRFAGKIEQRPPKYSAVKVRGKPAYWYARRGKEVELSRRAVEVREIQLLDYHYPTLKLRMVTGKGVYIRALARDIGIRLGTGGYLAGLERVRVGRFTKEEAVQLEEIEDYWQGLR